MSKNIFYRDEDLKEIENRVSEIEQEATKKANEILEPNNEEYKRVSELVIEFIKEHKLIIYGGTAYNSIIKDNNKKEKIYEEWERHDVEFYSPTPIKHMVMLCNKLADEGYKYVTGRQANHDETFSIFVNFLVYCDISYMTPELNKVIKTVEIEGIRYIHPNYILIDIFRMINAPLVAYFRITKFFKRMKKLIENFKFDFRELKEEDIYKIEKRDDKLSTIIKMIIIHLNENYEGNILYIGEIAYLRYTQQEVSFNNVSQIEIITDEPDEVLKVVKNKIFSGEIEKDKLKVKRYSRFFQYFGTRTIIYYNDKPLITIFDSASCCSPYFNITVDNIKINIASYTMTFGFYFMAYEFERCMNQGYYYNIEILNSLLTIRNKYLKDNEKNVLDKTIYKEYIIDCMNKTIDFKRDYMLRMIEKKKQGLPILISYNPIEDRGEHINYQVEQSDGLEIKE